MAEYNRQKAIEAQKNYCKEKGLPHFAPRDGECYCGKNIYVERKYEACGRTFSSGISVEKAGKELITGCPHCNITYCD